MCLNIIYTVKYWSTPLAQTHTKITLNNILYARKCSTESMYNIIQDDDYTTRNTEYINKFYISNIYKDITYPNTLALILTHSSHTDTHTRIDIHPRFRIFIFVELVFSCPVSHFIIKPSKICVCTIYIEIYVSFYVM